MPAWAPYAIAAGATLLSGLLGRKKPAKAQTSYGVSYVRMPNGSVMKLYKPLGTNMQESTPSLGSVFANALNAGAQTYLVGQLGKQPETKVVPDSMVPRIAPSGIPEFPGVPYEATPEMPLNPWDPGYRW